MSKLKRTFVSFFGPKLQAKRRGAVAIFAALALVLTLGVVALPVAGAEPSEPPAGQTLNVAEWTGPTTLENVSGRQATIKVGDTYHMWYATNDTTLYHTSSTDPASFETSTENTFDTGPVEVASMTVWHEAGTYYMITYETSVEGGNQKFAIYTSSDGNAWTYGGTVFDGTTAFSGLTSFFTKVDGPYLFKDENTYRLYFQVKTNDSGTNYYNIYTAESTESLASIVGNGADFTLANDGTPVLSHGETESEWDGTCVMHPMVVKDGDTYYMWYSAHNGQPQQIGFASSADGYDWVKSPGNPILPRETYSAVGEPSVIKDGDTWRMWYLTATAGGINYLTATGPFEFSTIQSAIDAASDGDTINVAPGTYDGNISINKSVTLSGAGANTTTIRGNETGVVVTITASNVTLQGFSVNGSGSDIKLHAGIVLQGVTGCTIENNSVSNNTANGIALAMSSNNTIQYNTTNNNGAWGIVVVNPGKATLYGGGPYDDVVAMASTGNTFEGNISNNNGKEGLYLDLYCHNNEVIDNTLSNNILSGIYIYEASNNTITGNTISDNNESGLYIRSSGNTVSGNTITNNNTIASIEHAGIYLKSGWLDFVSQIDGNQILAENNSINQNTITGNGNAGVFYQDNEGGLEGPVGEQTFVAYPYDDDIVIDALYNWWGDETGPEHATLNIGGQGNAVSDNVNFSPWL